MQLALKSDASLDSAYLNEPSKCWNAVMVFCRFRGFPTKEPWEPRSQRCVDAQFLFILLERS